MRLFVWLPFALSATLSCSGNDPAAASNATGAVCANGSTLTYDNFGKAFMTSYCIRCHSSTLSGSARNGAPSDHNFDSLEAIHSTELSHIDQAAAAGPNYTNNLMPPAAPFPTLAERKQLGEWLACNAP